MSHVYLFSQFSAKRLSLVTLALAQVEFEISNVVTNGILGILLKSMVSLLFSFLEAVGSRLLGWLDFLEDSNLKLISSRWISL